MTEIVLGKRYCDSCEWELKHPLGNANFPTIETKDQIIRDRDNKELSVWAIYRAGRVVRVEWARTNGLHIETHELNA